MNGTVTRQFVTDESRAISKIVVPGTGGGPDTTYLVTWNGHGDALNLLRLNADGTTTLANSFTYDTWGRPSTTVHNGIADLGFRYLYVGQFDVQWDDQFGLGLHYMHARHYAPALGRFLQPDPARVEENHHAYASNSPVSRMDPCGLATTSTIVCASCGCIQLKVTPTQLGGRAIFVQIDHQLSRFGMYISTSSGTVRVHNLFTGGTKSVNWFTWHLPYLPSRTYMSIPLRSAGLVRVSITSATWWLGPGFFPTICILTRQPSVLVEVK